jgi:hypothetical protein
MSKKPEYEFDPSGTIAMFIAAALQHPNPPCNSKRRRVSTIAVSQHKNKFDQVVVYCTLAETNEVSEAWAEQGGAGDPPAEFVDKCLYSDAVLYRKAYRKMLFLAPQFRDMTLARPDYGYLLFNTKDELDAWLAHKSEYAKEPNGEHPGLLKRWHAADPAELRSKLHKVYDSRW